MGRLRASGWASQVPRVVGQRTPGEARLDRRPARTSVPQRVWYPVPEGPWPCQVCGEFLKPGTSAKREIVRDEPFYRHPACQPPAPVQSPRTSS